MRVGISLNIDVTKIEKSRLIHGEKGTYADFTTFVNLDEQDKYGNNGFITQSKTKSKDVKLPILGNAKVFWTDGETAKTEPADAPDFEDEIPF